MWAAFAGVIVTFGLTGAGYAAWYMQEGAPNDSTSRALNEMKAKARELPRAADPRDARIAELEKQVADLQAEVGLLRNASGNVADANRRISELERQLADRDRELTSLRSSAGDSSKLASQLSATQGQLDLAKGRISDLEKSLAAAGAGASAAELAAKSSSGDADKLAADLDAAHRRIADLERQLAALQGDLSAEMAKLKEAQRGLIRALRPQIEKGDITVDLNNERLLINLASSYLFGTGEDTLKTAGADALKHVGAVLKDFPEYKVAVDGHTDNVPIRGSLKKRFPTNQELSESRAANAAKALAEGGLTGAMTAGYADTRPVESNKTAEGRAKNRRVEVRVTK
jgi:chemotaxis protein MotB